MAVTDRRQRARSEIERVAQDLGLPTALTILSERWNTVAQLGNSGVIAKAATLADIARSDPAYWFQLELDVCTVLSERGIAVQQPYRAEAIVIDDLPITLWHEVDGEMGECTEDRLVESLARMHEVGADLLSDRPWFATITTHFDDVFPILAERKTIPKETLTYLQDHYDRLMDEVVASETSNRFIHGDAQRKNALRTSDGAVWIDFEESSWGPVAWDLACLTMHRRFDTDRVLTRYAELTGNQRIQTSVIDTLKQLRDLEAVTWMLAIQDEREPGFRIEAANLLNEVLTAASAG